MAAIEAATAAGMSASSYGVSRRGRSLAIRTAISHSTPRRPRGGTVKACCPCQVCAWNMVPAQGLAMLR
jgi:hypothetical protein